MLPEDPVEVLVREGVVEIKRPAIPVAAPVVVRIDEKATAPADAPIVVTPERPDNMARDLAWKAGRIAFEDTSLASVAREFARYSQTRIIIDDPAVARRTVTGLFVSNDPVGFAKGVALSFHLKAEVGQDEVRLKQ
jgi:transmembrane sensor